MIKDTTKDITAEDLGLYDWNEEQAYWSLCGSDGILIKGVLSADLSSAIPILNEFHEAQELLNNGNWKKGQNSSYPCRITFQYAREEAKQRGLDAIALTDGKEVLKVHYVK